MGTDRMVWIGIGFEFELEEVISKYSRTTEDQTHTEDRWDSKTGKEAEPEVVVDVEGGEVYEYDGKQYKDEEYNDLLDALGKEVGAEAYSYGDAQDGDCLAMMFAVSQKDLKTIDGGCHIGGRCDVGPSYDFESVAKAADKLEGIKEALKKKFGLKPGKAQVVQCWEIC